MPDQPNLVPVAAPPPKPAQAGLPYVGQLNPAPPSATPAPLWFQRLSLFILVIFCVYLGVAVTVMPWLRSTWDENGFFLAHPHLWAVLRLGPVRGLISGMGLLDIWIGISEAIHYRDQRP